MRRYLILLLTLCLLAPIALAEEAAPMGVSLDEITIQAPEAAQEIEAPSLYAAEPASDSQDIVPQDAAAPASQAGVTVVSMTGNTTFSAIVGQQCRIEADRVIVSCKSSKQKVAAVTDDGMITPIAPGKAKITVRFADKKKYKLQLTVTDPTIPTGIAIEQGGEVLLDRTGTLQLTYALSPATAVSDVTWKSSKNKVATVSATGLVTPLKAGSTTITAKTAKGKRSAKIKVNVVDMHAPVSVSIDHEANMQLGVGESVQLNAIATALQEPAITAFTWSSSKKKVATVSDTGLVTALKAGTAKITVKTDNKKKATITVQVGSASSESQIPAQPAVTGRIDLYPYLRTDMRKMAKELGLREKVFPIDVGGYEETYENDCLSVTLNNYSSSVEPTPVEIIWLEKDPEGKYCVDGYYLGMKQSDVEAQLVQKGFIIEDSSMRDGLLYTLYSKGAYAISFYYRDQTLVHINAEFRPWDA